LRALAAGKGIILKCFLAVLILYVLAACSLKSTASDRCLEAYQVYWGYDWDKVIDLTTEAIDMEPGFPWAYSLRGVAYTWKGRYEEAILDFDTAIMIDASFTAAYTNRAITCLKMGNIEQSERDLESALLLSPGDVISLVTMAEVQSIIERVDAACTYLDAAIMYGFNDMQSIEKNANFDNVFYSACYGDILKKLKMKAQLR
jgi:tetratricopeptide (TPR) repeat protein